MAESDFVDYYELMQISPNAEMETIQRIYRMLATRYHPDNPQTGDLSRFLLVNQAYETLSNPELRAAYNDHYEESSAKPIEVFETKDFDLGVDGESNRRLGVLCLLYTRRRSNPDDAGMSLLEFERTMSAPREHLLFTMWYLKEHDCVRQDERSDYVITGTGVDYVEKHVPQNKVMYKLLKAAESGSSRASNPEANESDGNSLSPKN